MPNHVTNRLIIKACNKDVNIVLDFLKGEPYDDGSPRYIDFNKIIPMPEALNINSGNLGEIGMNYILVKSVKYDFFGRHEDTKSKFLRMDEKMQKESLELGRRYLLNIVFFGWATWYEWCNENWGTKWNAYDQDLKNENEIWFNTAWSSVEGILVKLSEKFPDVEFEYTYADEDTGCNTGIGIIKDGVSHIQSPENGSIEAYELAFKMHPDKKGYYELTPDGYKCKEYED